MCEVCEDFIEIVDYIGDVLISGAIDKTEANRLLRYARKRWLCR